MNRRKISSNLGTLGVLGGLKSLGSLKSLGGKTPRQLANERNLKREKILADKRSQVILDNRSSSAIASSEYIPALHELIVSFVGGGTYKYFGVPEATMDRWAEAPSRGRFFVDFIRDNYPFIRMS